MMLAKKNDTIFGCHVSLEDQYPFLKSHKELKPIFEILRFELQRHLRPASETILCDEHVMKILGIQKRKLEYMKANREIPFYNPPMQRDFFILGEILSWLAKYKVDTIDDNCRI
jgi:hypothetical protein